MLTTRLTLRRGVCDLQYKGAARFDQRSALGSLRLGRWTIYRALGYLQQSLEGGRKLWEGGKGLD